MSSDATGMSAAKLALAVKRARAENRDADLGRSEPIAVVGIGCRFPGGASPAGYWQMLLDGVDAVREVPASRWIADDWYDADLHAAGKMNTRWGSFVDDVESFDPAFFGIAPREAAAMDPQQRLLLEVTWEALWNAGLAPEQLAGSQTGVFTSAYTTDYARMLLADAREIGPHSCAGGSHAIASGRLSFLLDLRGPSISIDTACSSSLVAVHLACQSLRAGDSHLAIAGGVTLHLTPEHWVSLSKLGMLSPDGRCRTFDARANGFVPGEGCGVVVLKRLADAIADGDRIHAVIRGTAVLQDGRSTVLTAPNGLAQQEVIRAALGNGRVLPEQIGYVEAHGTGTPLGDPIEVEALAEVLGGSPSCVIGSVKSNMGHLEAAAGIAGLIKAVLALEHERIPRNLHFENANPHVSLDETPFTVPTVTVNWPRGSTPRFAGVSGFGFGGTNAHIVLEEAPRLPAPAVEPTVGPFLLPISARGAGALTELARRYEACLADATAPIGDICRAAALRRGHYEERIAVVGSTAEALRDALRDAAAGTSRLGVSRGSGTEDAGVVFVCSGQGSQWAGMGAQLMRREPAFRDAIEECETSVQRYGGWSITRELEADESASRLAHTEFAQPAIVAIEIAIARLWQSWGITPSAVIGHSVGEIAAAHIAGIIELDEAMRIAVLRGRLMERATGTGRMAAIFANAHEIEADLAEFGGALSLAAINGPQSVVASGDASAVEALVERCRARNIASRPLGVDYAFHSTQMEPFAGALARELGTVAVRRSTIPMISTVTGDVIAGDTLDAAYWGRNIRQTVRFGDATVCALAMNVGLFVEVGPHPVLAVSVQECVAAAGGTASAIASLRRQQDERSTMLASLATLYARGASVDWSAVYPGPSAVVDLPAYPYQRDRHWIRRAAAASVASSRRRPMLEQRVLSPLLAGDGFESRISLATHPYLADHRIGGSVILPMTGFVELVLEAIAEASGATAIVLEDVVVQRPIVLAGDHARTVQVLLEGAGFRVFGLEGERWELCATGRFHSAVTDVANAAPEVSGEPRDPSAHYRHAATRGAEFGPAFQTVVELRASDETAAATVRLAGSERAKGYQIHPALLDGCFQTVLAAGRDGGSWVPIAIDRLEIVAPADSEVRSVLRTRPRDADSQTLTADLWISTPAGRSIAVVTGLRLAPMVAPAQGASRFAYVTRWRSRDRGEARRAGDAPGRWLILGDNAGIGPELRSALETRGQACAFMASSAPAESPALDGLRGVIVIEGDAPNIASTTAAARRVVREALELVQRVARGPGDAPELWFLTRGAVAAVPNDDVGGLSQSPVLGLARSIAIELPDFKCATIDISDATDASSVAAEILDSDGEDRVAFRGGIRYVPRLEPVAATSAPAERRLAIPARGSIDGLTFEPLHRRAPGAGEIEVAVGAASLNFRDVMNVLDMYPGDAGPLGVEFVGRVARVGDGVSPWQPGDRVMGIAWGSFATHVTTPASLVTAVPAAMDVDDAATIPNAFLTAHYCLIRTARLRAGERVLVHSGAGGVGMAAIQIALDAGAEVFATAGSEEKRALLRSLGVHHVFNSRTMEFAREILDLTRGEGVNVVLNALAGDFIGASLAATARKGRFVEIGKMGLWTSAQVDALGKEIQYSVIDLADVIAEQPSVIGEELTAIGDLLAAGRLRALPRRVFDLDEAQTAFRYMAQARHTGRVVLRITPREAVRADGTYLVTGGLGAIGLHVARWLAERGAAHIVLVGRSGPTPEALAAIEAIRATGASVVTAPADVADRDQMQALLGGIAQTMPPLHGVVHAAGVVDDGVLVQQTWDRAAAVLAPKVDGAWNLHELTSHLPLDFFVLCSSMASVVGSPAQGAYAAGNAFLDALAERRRALGQCALSINWGAWEGAGMAGRVVAQGRARVLDAVRPMSPRDCVAALDRALRERHTQVVVADVDWRAWRGAVPSVLSDLVSSRQAQAGTVTDAQPSAPEVESIADKLAAAPAASRRGVLMAFIRQEARRVLGLSDGHPVDERQPLLRLGLDSLMAVELRNRLSVALQRALPATLLFDHPSPAALADFLLGAEARETNTADPLLADIASMSDEEAERMLERELDGIG